MKKTLFYLFVALFVGACLFVACNEGIIIPDHVCYCSYDGKSPSFYDYDQMKKLGFIRCSELEAFLQENEPDHKVGCRMIKDIYKDEMLENAAGK